jgi:hypothetical protein
MKAYACFGLMAALALVGCATQSQFLDSKQPKATALSEQEAHAIGVDAYIYFYPLVSMDLTRKQCTNIESGKEFGKGPMNTFAHITEYPPANFKGVVRSNFDTLYSVAWLDLTKEPMMVSVPDTGGRYYLLPMRDMWTDVFASPGWRTTGTQAGNFLIAPPGWRPDLRDRFSEEFRLPKDTQRIDAPTPYVWIIGRTKTDGPPDYEAGRGENRSNRRHENTAEEPDRHHASGTQLQRLRLLVWHNAGDEWHA